MIRTSLRYHRPETDSEVSELLRLYDGDIAVLGGGTQLLPKLTRDEISVAHLVDLQNLGLDQIVVTDDRIVIGASVTYDDILRSEVLAVAEPHLARVAWGVTGGRQIRNRATLIGAVCFAMPGTDAPAALAGLGATYRVHGPSGVRSVGAATFHTGAFTTALEPGEFVKSLELPRRRRLTGYCKVKHSASSWPIVTATYCEDDDGATVTLGGAQPVPLRVELDRAELSKERLVAKIAAAVDNPWTDILAPGSYRRRIAGVVGYRAYQESRPISNREEEL